MFAAPIIGKRAVMATTARDVMTDPPDFLKEDAPVRDAAERMASEDVGALPVCNADGRLVGMVTDRDIVVKVLAKGDDPGATNVGQLTGDQSEAVTIGADDSVEEALKTMADHQVRRLPVIDGTEMVGIVAQADLARACPPEKVGELLEAISR
jgi:CBS domain-containing protein